MNTATKIINPTVGQVAVTGLAHYGRCQRCGRLSETALCEPCKKEIVAIKLQPSMYDSHFKTVQVIGKDIFINGEWKQSEPTLAVAESIGRYFRRKFAAHNLSVRNTVARIQGRG